MGEIMQALLDDAVLKQPMIFSSNKLLTEHMETQHAEAALYNTKNLHSLGA